MKKIFLLLSGFSILNFAFAQIVDCNDLINIDLLEEKFVHNNSYSTQEIIVDKSIIDGMIVSEKAIKLTKGSYGNSNDDSYFIATIGSCEDIKTENQIYEEEDIKPKIEIYEEEAINEEYKISVYPNPSSNFVNINWNKRKIKLAILTTIEGKTLKTLTVPNGMNKGVFDVSELAKGIYRVVLVENGNREFFKIVKN